MVKLVFSFLHQKKSSERMNLFMKMKATLKLLLVALFAASVLLLVSCSSTTHIVNFDADGGTAVAGVEVESGKMIGMAPITAKEGYTFNGWYFGEDEWDCEHYAITKDMTLKAKWTKIHTVSFDSNGGNPVNDVKVSDGSKVAAPANPIKSGAEFLGWYFGEELWNFDNNAITSDIKLTAKWREIFVVNFLPDGGDFVTAQSVKYGDLIVKPNDPTRYSHSFAGWYEFDVESGAFISDTPWDFSAKVTGNVTLKAKWSPIYTVSFSTEGAGKIDALKLPEGSLIPKPDEIKKEGYIFLGWYYGEKLWNFSDPVTSSMKLVAKWAPFTYGVIIDKTNGEDPIQLNIAPNTQVPNPGTPAYAGHVFLGWYVFNPADNTLSATPWDFENSLVTSELVIKAKWIKLLNVSFVVEGNVIDSFTVYDGSTVEAPEEIPAKDGSTFIGWYCGDKLYNFDSAITADTTITAKFLTNHKVTFDLNGVAVDGFQTEYPLLYGDKVTKPADPTSADCVFEGWYNGDVLWNFDEDVVTSDITLKAKWAAKVTVTFLDSDRAPITSMKVVAGYVMSAPEAPTKELYLFNYWRTEDGQIWNFETDVVEGNMTLFAEWTINYWVITFDTDGAGEIDPIFVEKGKTFTEPAKPEKENVGFLGWVYASTGAPFDFTKAPTADTVLKATWSNEFYTVTYMNNGSVIKIRNVAWDNPYAPEFLDPINNLAKPDPEKEYIFLGWKSSIKNDGYWNFAEDEVTENMTLTADWREVFIVTLETDGVVYGKITAYAGKPAGIYLNPTKASHTFDGWYDGDTLWNLETTLVTKSVTLVAKWKETPTVYYDLDNGYILDNSFIGYETVNKGEFFKAPKDPERAGYKFGGWYDEVGNKIWKFAEHKSDVDITLRAVWIPIYYVSFDLAGGTGNFQQKLEIVKGKSVSEIYPDASAFAPTKDYMTFAGWYVGNTPYDFTSDVNSNVTLTAKWTQNKFNVVFDANGGEGGATLEFNAGEKITAPTVTLDGYVLTGWQRPDGTYWNFDTDVLTAGITLKAIWNNDKVTIEFDLNGGAIAGSSAVPYQRVDYGTLISNPGTPTNGNYIFKGWFTPDNTKWNFATDKATASITLTAKWDEDLTVTFMTENGTYEEKNVAVGSLVTKPLIDPTKHGYVFLGWYLNENTKWDFATMPVTEDIVLEAKWQLVTFTVTFKVMNLETKEYEIYFTTTAAYQSLISCPDTPSIGDNYQFHSWRTEQGEIWNFNDDIVTENLTLRAFWVSPGSGSQGGVNGPLDENTATRGPIHNFP